MRKKLTSKQVRDILNNHIDHIMAVAFELGYGDRPSCATWVEDMCQHIADSGMSWASLSDFVTYVHTS